MSNASSQPQVAPVDAIRIERVILPFVLLVLAILVATPILVNRRVGTLRAEIEASEPARTAVTAIQFNLVREMAALSEAILTGDTAAATEYEAALIEEDSLFRAVEPLVRMLGGEVMGPYEEVRRRALIWHGRAADVRDLMLEEDGVIEPPRRRERRLFRELLQATNDLDRAILRRTEQLRAEINRAEQLGLNLSIGLGVLAIIAGGAAGALATRSRRFAAESERRRIEAEQALREVARVTEMRERLMRGITHDVKNPLGAAKGYAELLLMGVKAPILPEQVPLVAGVQRSVDRALHIIADLLDLSRADSGRLAVERVETDLRAIVGESVDDHRPLAEAAGLEMRYERPGAALRVHTDPGRVRQILQNLLSNAVKYTPAPGQITVSVTTALEKADDRSRSWAVVSVRDTGPGVPPELRERIFDEFTRLDEGSAIQGHGLGLAIARRMARLLGGDLDVADTDGPGATFVLRLPLRQLEPSPS